MLRTGFLPHGVGAVSPARRFQSGPVPRERRADFPRGWRAGAGGRDLVSEELFCVLQNPRPATRRTARGHPGALRRRQPPRAFHAGAGTRGNATRNPAEFVVWLHVYRHARKPTAQDIQVILEEIKGPGGQRPAPARTTDTTAIFEAENPGPRRPRAGLDETAGVRTDLAPGVLAKLRRERPPFNVTPLDLLPAEAVAVLVLAKGGATLPRRDATDERRLRQDRAGPERVILSQDDVGGYGLQPGGRRRRTPSRAWQSD